MRQLLRARSVISLLQRFPNIEFLSGYRPEVLPDHATFAIARDDDYFFGVLHSRAHEVWARAQGTQLREVESGFRYTPTSTFETFPFPWPPGKEPKDSPRSRPLPRPRGNWWSSATAGSIRPRRAPEELAKLTLTNLYNKRPKWLENAHRKLDEAVFAAYGWPAMLTDEEILERLLALNEIRSVQARAAAAAGELVRPA